VTASRDGGGGIFHGGDYGVFSVVLGDLGYRIDVDDVEGGGCEGPFRCLHLCLAPSSRVGSRNATANQGSRSGKRSWRSEYPFTHFSI